MFVVWARGNFMKELNNFNRHVSEIITPVLKELGFSKKNLHFRRQNGKYFEEINIQRSQFNLAGEENLFFVNLYWFNNNDYKYWFYQERLPNKPLLKCPERYKDYYADFSEDFRKTFSESEEAEIHNYRRATDWRYKNEAELVSILNTLADLSKQYIDEIFNGMEQNFDEEKVFGSEKFPYGLYNKELREKFNSLISYCTCAIV